MNLFQMDLVIREFELGTTSGARRAKFPSFRKFAVSGKISGITDPADCNDITKMDGGDGFSNPPHAKLPKMGKGVCQGKTGKINVFVQAADNSFQGPLKSVPNGRPGPAMFQP